MEKLKMILTNIFTGADNKTVAIGRVHSVPVLIAGLAVPFFMVYKGVSLDLSSLAVYWGGLGASIATIIRGTSGAEPKVPGPSAQEQVDN